MEQDTTQYRPLPLERRHAGYDMKQVKRDGDFAIYSNGDGFEVIRVRKSKGGKMFDKDVPPSELYPSDEQFGTYGWYFFGPNGREQAEAKLAQLKAKYAGVSDAAVDESLEVAGEAAKVVESLIG